MMGFLFLVKHSLNMVYTFQKRQLGMKILEYSIQMEQNPKVKLI
jgi:hypothetical protein